MNMHPSRFIKIVLLSVGFVWFALAPSYSQTNSPNDGCARCHATRDDASRRIVVLHRQSSHGQANLNCAACHRGDAAQADKAEAHAGMIAKPQANVLLATCGRCHAAPLAQFKASRHFQTREGEPRLDCAECHGVHSIGRPAETFSLAQYCASCHGLEYLPALPQPLQDLLALSDELRGTFNPPQRAISADAQRQRKEIRRQTAEIVHPTDRAGGLARIPSILAQGEKLRAQRNTSK